MIEIGKRVVAKKTTGGQGRREVGEVTNYDPDMKSGVTDSDASGAQSAAERATPYEVTWGFVDGTPDTSWHAEDELEVVV